MWRINSLSFCSYPGDVTLHLRQASHLSIRPSVCPSYAPIAINQSINQSVNVKFVGRRRTTRPESPAVVSGKHDQKAHESFSACTGVSNVVEVGRKSVPGGWATVGETSFSKSSSCS